MGKEKEGVMERWHKEICLYFHCENFSFLYYLSIRSCLYQFFSIYMFISEASAKYPHLIRAAVREVTEKCTRGVIWKYTQNDYDLSLNTSSH